MSAVRDLGKWLSRRLFGWDVLRVDEEAYALVPAARRQAAWFSLATQRDHLFRRESIDLVVDVGANVGQFVTLLRGSYAGEIVSFEPSPASFQTLAQHASGDPRWRAVQCALGACEGTMELRLAELSVLDSFLPRTESSAARFGTRSEQLRQESVRVRRLDAAVAEAVPDAATRRIFLKLDTQGFDLEVFRGIGALAPRIIGLQSEVSVGALYAGMPDWLESLREYRDGGFSLIGLYPGLRDARGNPMEFDCLMFRNEGQGRGTRAHR